MLNPSQAKKLKTAGIYKPEGFSAFGKEIIMKYSKKFMNLLVQLNQSTFCSTSIALLSWSEAQQ